MQAVAHGMEPPGASDKWRVLQLFHETVSKTKSRVERIDRVVSPADFARFGQQTASGENAEACGVAFFAPQSWDQLSRVCSSGFDEADLEDVPGLGSGIPVATTADLALERRQKQAQGSDCQGFLCVVLCGPQVMWAGGKVAGTRADQYLGRRERCIGDPAQLLLVHLVSFKLHDPDKGFPSDEVPRSLLEDQDLAAGEQRRIRLARQQQVYAKAQDPIIKAALEGLQGFPSGKTGTTLLPGTSAEAEAVVSLYLLGGGAAKIPRPPGVDIREALGGVVVQRIENQPLYAEYMALGDATPQNQYSKGPRWREDVVWHGTRVKKDDAGSLATKLQSIAEHGFDPQRCIKGAAAEGGIWVATNPMQSFGLGCDGLVAFILCLGKTNFNEWVDTSCARILQRERVLPLYSLVHA